MVLVMRIQKNESTEQLSSNESALHVQKKNLFWGLLLFWKKKKEEKY